MIGGTLGPYRLDRELGAGGMGKVYAATVSGRCPGLAEGTRVALKVVHPHLLETPGFFKRFLREAEIGKSVVHENVVRTYDADAVMSGGAQQNFLVMEYVEGQTLRSLLAELDRVPEELCRHIGREVAKGLAAIHAAGVVHRDMKPENVLITKDHQVKVMDLGVARLNDEALRLSQTGAFVGSIHYAAPECFREGGRQVDGRADLHALGLVLYELACGINPYLADDVPQILKKVLQEEPRRLGDINPQLSPFFEEVVHTLLAKRPEARFADAGALLAVLEEGEKSEWWRSRAKAIRAATKRPLRRIRIPRETAVYGRETELTKLRALFEKARSGDGQVVLLEGEAGIGKSRLVDELVGRLQRDGEPVNFLFGSYPPDGAATAAGALSTAFREQIGDADIGPYLPQTPLFVPAFEALLRGDATPSGCEALTRDSIATCFVHALRALAAERPTVLLVDDLHFASEDSRGMFTSLALAVPGHRTLLVGTTRPGADEKWVAGLTRLPQTSQMTLIRLGPKDLLALLKDSLRSEALAASLSAQIAQKSDGNPFFAFEIIRGLREGQFITQRDDGTWVSTREIDDIKIPSSVLDLVNARVADLSEEERDLLDVAACWGFEFDATLVGDSLGLPRVPTLKRFAQIEKKHRLVRCAGERFAFDHHQVQEALYDALPPQLAREYHAALAEALETRTKAAEKDPETLNGALCVDLCEHFLKGSPCVAGGGAQGTGAVPDARTGAGLASGESGSAMARGALRYLRPAQAHLSKGYLNAQGIALTERALAVPGLLAGAERAKALLRLADGPLELLGRRARQEACAREAERLAEEAGDDELRARAAGALGTVFHETSRQGEAEKAYRRALDLARAHGDRKAEAAATGNLGNVLYSLGRLAEAKEHYERNLALSREIGDRRGESAATGNLGNVLRSLGRLAEAKEHHERHLALCREIGDREGEARATGSLGGVFQSLGRLAEAKEHCERYLALSREIGDRQGEAAATGNLGSVFTSLGRLAEAKEHHERNLALSREIGHWQGEAAALHNLAGAHREAGDAARSEEGYEACLAVAAGTGFRHLQAATLRALGSVRAAAGDAERGRDALAAARDLAREIGVAGYEVLARCELALLPGGDATDALAAFAEHEARLDSDERPEARLLLWKATRDRAHLVEAKRILDEATAHVDAESRALMLTKLRVNREIVEACKAEGIA
jgi:tetratricopeptide (TPR) repeat protein